MKYIIHTAVIAAVLLLTACISSGEKKSIRLDTSIRTVSYLNPNIEQQASPIVVTFYQLKSPDAFKSANFFALHHKPAETLGADLLDKREFEIRPEQSLSIEQHAAPNTTYIGIVAGYRNPDIAEWRKLMAIPPDSRRLTLRVNLETQGFTAEIN